MPSREEEPRRRRKDYDRDRDSTKHKDKDRHKSSRSSRTPKKVSVAEYDTSRDREIDRTRERSSPESPKLGRSSTSPSLTRSRRPAMIVPELERRASTSSPSGSRTSLPYPSFSKAHSKEAVNARVDIYTPDPTDLGRDGHDNGVATAPTTPRRNDPPSPPLTNVDSPRRVGSAQSTRGREGGKKVDLKQGKVPMDTGHKGEYRPKFSNSRSSLRQAAAVDELSDASSRSQSPESGSVSSDRHTRPTKPRYLPPSQGSTHSIRSVSGSSSQPSTITKATTDSNATSVAPNQTTTPSPFKFDSIRNPTPVQSHFDTLAQQSPKSSAFPSSQANPVGSSLIEVFVDEASQVTSMVPPEPPLHASPLPPPPPPPVMMPPEVPRVDYLLQNGGLPRLVSRSLLRSQPVEQTPMYQHYTSPQLNGPPTAEVTRLFAPLQGLLDDYAQVMSKNGSVAVATGYRSVARRLLDRLEHVFMRNISSEHCRCIICQANPHATMSDDEDTGVSWGEILEFVAGRKELPSWPPFSITSESKGLGIAGFESKTPMQKLDIDVPEEYREHYIRQSQKTKVAVQSWLASQPEFPSSPPQEIDDETLTFAMLTHLEPEQQRLFTALLRGMTSVPTSRAPTPLEKSKSDLMSKTALALQRLYRLASPPRDPECTMYLLKYPDLHNILATLAAISAGEWDILISGRFDGFLWSGAETANPATNNISTMNSPAASRGPSRGPTATPLSRTTTPFSVGNGTTPYSRGTTPFTHFPPSRPATASSQTPGPVQMDEETEIAVLAEVEREIYLGMEALENAFEALHVKAEAVRRSLRERGAGLAIAAQARRGSSAEGVEVRMGTPASASGWNVNGWTGANGAEAWDGSVTDDWNDERSELAPDDSASNVSWRRRPKRRHERRTPAPVEEEGSEYGSTVAGR